jgi:hypothetical protein
MADVEVPRCPGCCAAIPLSAPHEIVECECCGATSNLTRGRIPLPETPSPEPAAPPPGREIRDLSYEELVHEVSKSADPERRLAAAQRLSGLSGGADTLVWAPLLADLMPADDRKMDLALGGALKSIAWFGGTRARRQVFAVVERRALDARPWSHGFLTALCGTHAAALRLTLDLAQAAGEEGATEFVEDALEHVRMIVDDEEGDDLALCMDILFYRLTEISGPVADWLVRYLADCLDSEYDVPLPGPREYKDFKFLLVPVIGLIDDLLLDRPKTAKALIDAIADGYSSCRKNQSDMKRWVKAIGTAPSPEGRTALIDLFNRLYDTRYMLGYLLDFDRLLPPLPETLPRKAVVVAGQSPCPGCGFPLPLTEGAVFVTCESCGGESRLVRGVRTVEPEIKLDRSAALETVDPEELVLRLEAATDPDERLVIAREMDSADVDGTRYAPFAHRIVGVMQDADEELDRTLGDALGRMLRNGGPEMRENLLAAVHSMALGAGGSTWLVRRLGEMGADQVPLLLDIAGPSIAAAEADWQSPAAQYGHAALSAALEAMQWADDDMLAACVDEVLPRLEGMPYSMRSQVGGFLGMLFQLREGFQPVHETILRFIDDRIDPATTTWFPVTFGENAAAQMLFTTGTGMDVLDAVQSSVADQWSPPRDREDLLARLGLLVNTRTDETKAIILKSLSACPEDAGPGDVARVHETLGLLADAPQLQALVEYVAGSFPSA